jgi:thiosulfate/3-mercaptopyruvate sulfurtransferase
MVDAAELRASLDSTTVLDVRSAADFALGHVPGSLSLPLGAVALERSTHEDLLRLAGAARAALAAVGVDGSRPVVLVDDRDGAAAVALLVCELVGLVDVRVLRAGIESWMTAGGDLVAGPVERTAVGLDTRTSTRTVASIDDLVHGWQGAARVIDVRSQLEFEGIVGSPCCAGRGHIPGAVHLDWTTLVDPTGDLHDAGRVLAEAELVGLSPADDVIVYCHNGQRAAIAALALRDAGFASVRTSLGSWHEWSHRSMPRGLDA